MNIEGVNYEINWKKFKKGFSFFIPCNDAVVTRNNIAKITKRLKMSTTTKVVIEEGIKGLRVWRT